VDTHDALGNAIPEIEISDIARRVLEKRYLIKDDDGNPLERPMDLFRRVARTIAEGEMKFRTYGKHHSEVVPKWEAKFLELMASRKFMPNSPTLMNAGRPLGQLSACFVLPIEDSIDSIYETLKHQAIIHKSGGGTGFSFSRLRPKNDIVRSTQGVSSGPVSFLTVYDASTEHIKQGGTRRGANMGILRVDHPDIREFVHCKEANDKINNFNISVGITDVFMECVRTGDVFILRSPRDGSIVEEVDARELWNEIVKGAWLNGEPGIVFLDRINDRNPTPQFPIEATNPCSEAHLPPYDVCNLGSINVAAFYDPRNKPTIDWHGLADAVKTAVRFLDNVIEVNNYPLPQIEEMSKGNRRIGLGVMGFADLLIKLGIRYDSEAGFAFGRELMAFVDDTARDASEELAMERGDFPNWEGSVFGPNGEGRHMRNATVTTIAPTGTISMIAGCSGGIEPLFAIAFKRRQADMEMNDVNADFERYLESFELTPEAHAQALDLVADEGNLGSFVNPIYADMRRIFRTAGEIAAEDHIRMQAAFQHHTSMGISKTINLPHEATVEDVKRAYEMAYDMGCTGTAVYRDGSRDAQVLSTGKTVTKDVSKEAAKEIVKEVIEKQVTLAEIRNGRPNELTGTTKRITTGHGDLYVTMNDDDFGPREAFVILGKPGTVTAAFTDALGRMLSLAMKYGAHPEEIVHQLRGIQDGHPAGFGPAAVLSVPDGVARAFAEHYGLEGPKHDKAIPLASACPECGSALTRQEGCNVCHSCGYSRCS
jgi:ribonucleoside-diphosphate reductase alpha chain